MNTTRRLARELSGAASDFTIGVTRLHYTPASVATRVPVLVLPGLLADDIPTVELRRYLTRCGHQVEPWRLGRNLGPTTWILNSLRAELDDLYSSAGPVSLVGWSLGGIYARWLAHTAPHQVRQVITLGSPWAIPDNHPCPAATLLRCINILRPTHIHEVLSTSRQPLPVPSTAIYSRGDGVIDWEYCVDPYGENIEVTGSHCGLTHNPAAARAIAALLARPVQTLVGAAA